VNFCRKRLGELGEAITATGRPATMTGPGSLILPTGCASVDDMADQFLAAHAPDDLLDFDH
jgi:hypothetical protein